MVVITGNNLCHTSLETFQDTLETWAAALLCYAVMLRLSCIMLSCCSMFTPSISQILLLVFSVPPSEAEYFVFPKIKTRGINNSFWFLLWNSFEVLDDVPH